MALTLCGLTARSDVRGDGHLEGGDEHAAHRELVEQAPEVAGMEGEGRARAAQEERHEGVDRLDEDDEPEADGASHTHRRQHGVVCEEDRDKQIYRFIY